MLKYLYFVILLCIVCGLETDSKASPFLHGKFVLITIDGVRWQEIYSGNKPWSAETYPSRENLPNLYHYFVDEGMAIGKESRAETSNYAHVSQPGYLEIARGTQTTDCFNNFCPANTQPTVFDRFSNSAVFASWDTIKKVFAAERSISNIGNHYRSDKWKQLRLPEIEETDEFDEEEYRSDARTIRAANAYLYRYNQPDFMWIQLGDTDEYAHAGNYSKYLESLKQMDVFIGSLIQRLDRDTVFVICPDHGRGTDWRNHGSDIESGRVFILLRNAGKERGFVRYDRTVYLKDIANTVEELRSGNIYPNSLTHTSK